MANLSELCSILESIKKSAGELETKSVVFDYSDKGNVQTVVQDERKSLSDYDRMIQDEWAKQEEGLTHRPQEEERIIQFRELVAATRQSNQLSKNK